jgi:RNA polymerase sigma-70 factor (ECF subfamily)
MEGTRNRTYHPPGSALPVCVTSDQADALYRLLSPALRRHCLRLSGNQADAEDLVQEAFAALLRRGGPVAPDEAARMLATCARNAHVSRWRRERRSVPLADPDATGRGDVAATVAHRLELAALASAVRRLPERQRRALALAGCGSSSREIGSEFGLDANAVNQLLHRARAGVRAMTAA